MSGSNREKIAVKNRLDNDYVKGDDMVYGRYREFYSLKDELISQGKRFDENTLKLLSFKDLQLACVGNAGKAACSYDLVVAEENNRINAVTRFTFEDIENDKGKWSILDDNSMYWRYYVSKSKTIKMSDAPKWRLLVGAMMDLRGNWSGGRDSEHLARIYSLLGEVELEGIVPLGWCKAVKMNADMFDGEWNDGRIMRDGHMRLPEDIAKYLGFPAADASGNVAKLLGAKVEKRPGGYRGSYTELFEDILAPEQKVIFVSKLEGEDE